MNNGPFVIAQPVCRTAFTPEARTTLTLPGVTFGPVGAWDEAPSAGPEAHANPRAVAVHRRGARGTRSRAPPLGFSMSRPVPAIPCACKLGIDGDALCEDFYVHAAERATPQAGGASGVRYVPSSGLWDARGGVSRMSCAACRTEGVAGRSACTVTLSATRVEQDLARGPRRQPRAPAFRATSASLARRRGRKLQSRDGPSSLFAARAGAGHAGAQPRASEAGS